MENKHTQQVDFSNPNADKITSGTTNKTMENKKQTAVEWLVEQYEKSFTLKVNNVMTSIIEQGKAMEKEQIIDAITYGCSDWGSVKNAEAYYNKNFNK